MFKITTFVSRCFRLAKLSPPLCFVWFIANHLNWERGLERGLKAMDIYGSFLLRQFPSTIEDAEGPGGRQGVAVHERLHVARQENPAPRGQNLERRPVAWRRVPPGSSHLANPPPAMWHGVRFPKLFADFGVLFFLERR